MHAHNQHRHVPTSACAPVARHKGLFFVLKDVNLIHHFFKSMLNSDAVEQVCEPDQIHILYGFRRELRAKQNHRRHHRSKIVSEITAILQAQFFAQAAPYFPRLGMR